MRTVIKALVSALLIFLLIGCYKVKEYRLLFITFNDSRLNSHFLQKYIDSVHNKNLVIPDSIDNIFFHGNKIDEQERLIYFKSAPQEWYLIDFNASPCWIELIYNSGLSNQSINERDSLSKSELRRIEERFRNEVLNPAERYGKLHHLPDSILYNIKYK